MPSIHVTNSIFISQIIKTNIFLWILPWNSKKIPLQWQPLKGLDKGVVWKRLLKSQIVTLPLKNINFLGNTRCKSILIMWIPLHHIALKLVVLDVFRDDLLVNHSEIDDFDRWGALNTKNVTVFGIEFDITYFDWLGVLDFAWIFGWTQVPDVDLIFVGWRDKHIFGLWKPQHVLYVALNL